MMAMDVNRLNHRGLALCKPQGFDGTCSRSSMQAKGRSATKGSENDGSLHGRGCTYADFFVRYRFATHPGVERGASSIGTYIGSWHLVALAMPKIRLRGMHGRYGRLKFVWRNKSQGDRRYRTVIVSPMLRKSFARRPG